MIDPDPTKLLGQTVESAVSRYMAEELDELDRAEEHAIFELVYDRIDSIILEEHPMWDHILLCVRPFAAAAHNMDDLDNMIKSVVDWLDHFDNFEIMLSVAKSNANFLELCDAQGEATPIETILAGLINLTFAQVEISFGGTSILMSLVEDRIEKIFRTPDTDDDELEACISHPIELDDDDYDDDRDDPPDDNSPINPAPELITV